MGLGSKPMGTATTCFGEFTDINLVFVYISNDETLTFYLKHGFPFRHDMFNGFITAVYKYRK